MNAPPDLRFEFVYTWEDMRTALRLMKIPVVKIETLRWISLLAVAVLVFVIFHQPKDASDTPETSVASPNLVFPEMLVKLIPWLAMVAAVVVLILRNILGARRRWQKQNKHELIQITLSLTCLIWETPSTRVENKWVNYERFTEGPTVFVLLLAPRRGTTLPKRVMTPDQILQVRDLLSKSIGNAKALDTLPTKNP